MSSKEQQQQMWKVNFPKMFIPKKKLVPCNSDAGGDEGSPNDSGTNNSCTRRLAREATYLLSQSLFYGPRICSVDTGVSSIPIKSN